MTNYNCDFERVKKILVNNFAIKENEIGDGQSFIWDLNLSSHDWIELIIAFEEEFGISIPDQDAEKITTVGSAVKYISENM